MNLNINQLDAILGVANTVIERLWPDPAQADAAKLELFKLQQSGELQQIVGQMEINKIEAASPSLFVSGWRPAVGWIGGIGLGYAAIFEPIARFISSVGFGYTGTFPVLDTTVTMQVLFGLLGLGTLRSWDKKNGVDTK